MHIYPVRIIKDLSVLAYVLFPVGSGVSLFRAGTIKMAGSLECSDALFLCS